MQERTQPRIAAAAATLLLVLLAGCGGTTGTVATSAAAGSNADTTASSQPTDAASTPADSGTLAFGQTYKWDDGLQVTITKPATYKPSKWAVTSGKEKNNLVVTVTLVNGTGAKFDPSMFHLSAQSGDADAEGVYDSGKGVGSSPETKLLPGRQAKWKAAFNVKNPKDLVLEVARDFDPDSVISQLG